VLSEEVEVASLGFGVGGERRRLVFRKGGKSELVEELP